MLAAFVVTSLADPSGDDLIGRGSDILLDLFEENDTPETAADLGTGDQSHVGLTIDAPSDDDWYEWTASVSGTLIVEVLFTHAEENDIDLAIHDALGNFIESSTSVADNEQVTIGVTAGSSYLIRVYGFDGSVHADYDLILNGPEVSIVQDRFEDNDTPESAADLGTGDQSHIDLTIDAPSDDDWYEWTASSSGTLTVDVLFMHAENNDIDLAVYDALGNIIESSTSVADNEQVTINVTAGSSYLIKVYGFDGSVHPDYDLILNGAEAVTELVVDEPDDEDDGNISAGDLSLREAIGIVSGHPTIRTIRFASNLDGQTIRLTLGELAITGSMTIDASELDSGLTIDASGNDPTPTFDDGSGSRVLNIDDGNATTSIEVTILGLRLTGGDVTGNGGAIRSTENLALIDSVVTGNTSATASDNSARGDGGGIWASGTTTITDSTISGNSTILIQMFGVGYGDGGRGGGLWLGDAATITGSEISNNSTADGSDQKDGGAGGGIYAAAALTIVDCQISGNAAGDGGDSYDRVIAAGDGGAGGGVFVAGALSVSNSTVSNNSAGAGGFNNGQFFSLGAPAPGGSGGAGGGVFAQGIVSTVDSAITGNVAGNAGGANYGRSGPAGNGGGIASSADLSILRSNVSDNRAGSAGVGNHERVDGGSGGGIWAGDAIEISDSFIRNNGTGFGGTADGEGAVGGAGGSGGGVFAVGMLEITNTTISGNVTHFGGGATGYDATGGSGGGGGGVFASSELSITDSTISGNSTGWGGPGFSGSKAQGGSGGGGGGIAAMGATNIAASVIYGNITGSGGSSSDGDDWYISGGSGGGGGGILALGPTTITGTTVSGNLTGQGGGNFGPDFTTNSIGTSGSGGGVFGLNLTVIESQIVDNRTGAGRDNPNGYAGNAGPGGGIWGQMVTIVDSVISRNSTGEEGTGKGSINGFEGRGGDGGGINASVLIIERSSVSENFTTGTNAEGGGIRATEVTITDSSISGNYTQGHFSDGGGIFARNATVQSSTLSGNYTEGKRSEGGGLATSQSGAVTFSGSTVSGNFTTGYLARGGGVFAPYSNVAFKQSTITNNRAMFSDGGGLWVYSGNVTIVGSIVAENVGGENPDLRLGSGTRIIQYSLIGDNAGTLLIASPTADANGNLIGSALGAGVLDPLLDPLADNGGPTSTHALLSGSPAIDAGDPDSVAGAGDVPLYDQRGMPFGRVEDGDGNAVQRIDIGSFELVIGAGMSAVQSKIPHADIVVPSDRSAEKPKHTKATLLNQSSKLVQPAHVEVHRAFPDSIAEVEPNSLQSEPPAFHDWPTSGETSPRSEGDLEIIAQFITAPRRRELPSGVLSGRPQGLASHPGILFDKNLLCVAGVRDSVDGQSTRSSEPPARRSSEHESSGQIGFETMNAAIESLFGFTS